MIKRSFGCIFELIFSRWADCCSIAGNAYRSSKLKSRERERERERESWILIEKLTKYMVLELAVSSRTYER